MFPSLLALALMLTLVSTDFSLQSSIAFDRSSAWWTAWFFKVGPLSVADWILVAVTGYTIVVAAFRFRRLPLRSDYLPMAILAFVYLGLGAAYNVFVFADWKTYLYDIKVVLYLTVPFLFLHYGARERIRRWFSPARIFILAGTASVIDFVVVTARGTSEYPSYLGLPAILQLAPLPVLVIGTVFAHKATQRWVFAILLAIELVDSINRLALGSIVVAAAALPLVILVHRKMNSAVRFLIVAGAIIGTNLFSIFMLTNPLHLSLLEAKASGAITRQIEWDNVLVNYEHNFPMAIGKGLGATWFEYIRIPAADVYAVGTSMGDTPQESLESPVKFIFNITAAALLYKWGIAGILLLAYLLSRFYGRLQLRYEEGVPAPDRSTSDLQVLMLIAFILALDNFTYVGLIKASLITSLIAFQTELRLPTVGLARQKAWRLQVAAPPVR